MKLNIFFYFLLALIPFKAFSDDTVYLLTLPKAGTHCIEKYFQLLNYLNKNPSCNIRRSHLSETYLGLPKNYFDNEDIKKIVLVRDLRDMFISTLNWIEDSRHYMHASVSFKAFWGLVPFEEKIREVIDYEHRPKHIVWKRKNRYIPQQIQKMVKRAIQLSKQPNTLVVKFEDLSGGMGREKQLETMKEINSYINLALEDDEYEFLMENLFGNKLIPTFTYRKGKTFGWKSLLSDSLCEQIWNLYGEDLLELGYEKEKLYD